MQKRISACLIDTPDDDAVERSSVSRSEALELLDRFCAAAEGFRSGRLAEIEVSLSFSRDLENDFVEFSMLGPDRFDGRHRFIHVSKLLGLLPLRRQDEWHLLFRTRDQAAEFVDAYFTAAEPAAFGEWMRGRGATRHRQDIEY